MNNEKLVFAREREGNSKLNSFEKSFEGSFVDKNKDVSYYKEKENELRKALEVREER